MLLTTKRLLRHATVWISSIAELVKNEFRKKKHDSRSVWGDSSVGTGMAYQLTMSS